MSLLSGSPAAAQAAVPRRVPATPPGTSAAAAVAAVQAAYRRGGTLAAGFEQSYTDRLRGKRRLESGQLWVSADGRVRWNYQQPERKDFIYDGHTAYFYEPESAQVTTFARFADSPLAEVLQVFWGQGAIQKRFDMADCTADCPPVLAGERAVVLTPRQPLPQVARLLVLLQASPPRIAAATLTDPLGNLTVYRFSDLHLGAAQAADLFAFTPPPGISILQANSP